MLEQDVLVGRDVDAVDGALGKACQYVVDSADPVVARAEVSELVIRLLAGLRGPLAREALGERVS